jgi:arylsulfatase A-like enzyme
MQPNILFLLVDGLRSDQIFNDTKTSVTPNIDFLKNNGLSFSQAISSADGTILSVNSIINGMYPNSTGTRSQKIIFKENNLIRFLSDCNYNIYGFLPKLTSFKTFIEMCTNKNIVYEPGPPTVPLFKTGQTILDFLDSKKSEPWFYFVHIFDLHALREGSIPDGLNDFDSEKFGHTKYERVVSSIDVWIGKILKKIDLKNTIVILTADHGEKIPIDDKDITKFEPKFESVTKLGRNTLPKFSHKLGGKTLYQFRKLISSVKVSQANKGLSSYQKRSRLPHFSMSLYDESLRIPLIFSGFGISTKSITKQVASVDIFPTIADLLEKPLTVKLDGNSLFPFFNNRVIPENPIYLHTMPHQEMKNEDSVGIRTSTYKFFRHARVPGQNLHLFNLKNDPFENFNISDDSPNIVNNMEEILEKYNENESVTENKSLDEEEQKISKELKKLGYM